MRISDWSSDVCSSDLGGEDHLSCAGGEIAPVFRSARLDNHRIALRRAGDVERTRDLEIFAFVIGLMNLRRIDYDAGFLVADEGVVLDRKRVVWGKGVAVSVDIGGSRINKKKNE